MKQRFFCSLIVVVLLALVSSLACAAEEFLSDSVQGDEPTATLTEAGKAKSALPDIQEYKHRKPCASCKPQPVAEPQPQPPAPAQPEPATRGSIEQMQLLHL